MPYLARYVALPFICSCLVAFFVTWLVQRMAHRLNVLDRPGAHKQHEHPTPTLGGLGVFAGFVSGVLLCGPVHPKLIYVLVASLLIVTVGLLDDTRGVSANLKLLCLAVCSAILCWGGIHLDVFGLTGFASWLLTFLWIGLVSSAFNGVDNADGAAAGLAALASLATFVISWETWQRDLAVVSLVLCGGCLGFLALNFPAPRAKIFLGDSGSLFIGFGLATLTVLGQWSPQGWKATSVAILLVMVPLFDFLFILIVRGLEGRYRRWDDPIRMCARDHTFHRLRQYGLRPVAALFTLYGGAILSGGLAVSGVCFPAVLTPGSLVACSLFILSLGFGLSRIKLSSDAYPSRELP